MRPAAAQITEPTPPPKEISVPEALVIAEPLLARRPLLIVTDFDGTLSTIVTDPWAAEMIPLARRALRSVAAQPDVHVAVLSGRTALDVASRVRVGGLTYLGNHGLERGRLDRRQRASTMAIETRATADRFLEMAERLAVEVARLVPEPWLIVERKPPAVAFHYRTASDPEAAAARVRAAIDAVDQEQVLIRFPGRRVVELRPPGATAKGEAFRELVEQHRPAAAFMLGDDVSDAHAFEILVEAREANQLDGLAIAVQAPVETPAIVAQMADLVLPSPIAAARFLSSIAKRTR